MQVEDFLLERYFAVHEFTAPYLLCCSDCETMTLGELLKQEGDNCLQEFLNIPLMYTESLGDPDLRKDIANLYETINANEVLIDAGAAACIFSVISTALSKGDHIIVQFPCYTSLSDLAKAYDIEISLWHQDPDKNWELDLNQLNELIKPNTKMLIVNSPNNPTGYLMDLCKFKEMIEICKKNNLLFLSDEVYRGLEDPSKRLPAACDLYENAISLGVMSKSYGLAGLRLGWFATHCKWLYDKITSFKDYTTICTAKPSEFLSKVALKHQNTIVQRNFEIVQNNIQLFDDFVNRHSDLFRWCKPNGGPVSFVELIGIQDSTKFCDILVKESGVLLAPGSTFHVHDKAYFRVGLGRKNFPEALNVLESYLKDNKEDLIKKANLS